jgi:hypothetical protein
MKITTQFIVRGLCVAVISSGLAFLVNGGNVLGQSLPSDELRVDPPPTGGPPSADFPIPETAGRGTESSAIFGPTPLTGLVTPGALAGIIPPGTAAGYAILTEPAGEPPDPNELPPVTFPGPNGPVIVSDLVVAGFLPSNALYVASRSVTAEPLVQRPANSCVRRIESPLPTTRNP